MVVFSEKSVHMHLTNVCTPMSSNCLQTANESDIFTCKYLWEYVLKRGITYFNKRKRKGNQKTNPKCY